MACSWTPCYNAEVVAHACAERLRRASVRRAVCFWRDRRTEAQSVAVLRGSYGWEGCALDRDRAGRYVSYSRVCAVIIAGYSLRSGHSREEGKPEEQTIRERANQLSARRRSLVGGEFLSSRRR